MARIRIGMNTREGKVGVLLPVDIQLNTAVIELFHYGCLSVSGPRIIPPYLDGVVIEKISYSNPFDITAYFKYVTKEVAEFALARTIFYRQEVRRRDLENEKSNQEVISLKLENLAKAEALRNHLKPYGGIEEYDAVTHTLAQILEDQKASIRLEDNRPSKS